MPNGTDCAAVLQTEAVCVPTQWFVLDCTADGRASAWLKADLANEIDYLHLPPGAGGDPKPAIIALRPRALHALLEAHGRRTAEGSKGRLVIWVIADLADPIGSRLLAELPLDLSNALFWKTGVVPALIRGGVDGDDGDRRRCLAVVREQYFGLPDFSLPYYGKHTPGQLYGNEFDSTFLARSEADLAALVEHLVPLHLEETRFAKAHLQRHSPGGMFVIEEVMTNSMRWRKIDWFAVTAYPYFKRLWDVSREDVRDVLDYRRCPNRAKDPWAALDGRKREKNWDDLGLDAVRWNPLDGEQAYRVTPGDHRTRLLLAGFLMRHEAHTEVLQHCDLARSESDNEHAGRWIKVEAMARHGLGDDVQARALFAAYRTTLQAVPDPSAEVLDEIGGIALMEGDFALAYQSAHRAVEKDRFLGHAYDTMVIAGRSSGNAEYERTAAELAAANGVTVPIHVRERTSEVLKGAKVVPAGVAAPAKKKWWQFWR